MEQKPKRTEADENRRRNLAVMVIILLFGLFFAGVSYYNFLQNRAMSAAAPMILTVDADDTATSTPIPFTPTPTDRPTYTASPSALPSYTSSALAPNENGVTLTPSPPAPGEESPSSTPSPLAPEELETDATEAPVCFFNWAYGPVPENHVVAMRESLDSAGYDDAELETLGYGEDRICMLGDEIVSSRFGLMDFTPTILINVDDETFDNPMALGAIIRDLLITITETPDIPYISKIEVELLNADESRLWVASYQDITFFLTRRTDDDALYKHGIPED